MMKEELPKLFKVFWILLETTNFSKIVDASPSTLPIHCHAHRLALACNYSVEILEEYKIFEQNLIQIWKFFVSSPLRSSKLQISINECQKEKKTKACIKMWLSHDLSLIHI